MCTGRRANRGARRHRRGAHAASRPVEHLTGVVIVDAATPWVDRYRAWAFGLDPEPASPPACRTPATRASTSACGSIRRRSSRRGCVTETPSRCAWARVSRHTAPVMASAPSTDGTAGAPTDRTVTVPAISMLQTPSCRPKARPQLHPRRCRVWGSNSAEMVQRRGCRGANCQLHPRRCPAPHRTARRGPMDALWTPWTPAPVGVRIPAAPKGRVRRAIWCRSKAAGPEHGTESMRSGRHAAASWEDAAMSGTPRDPAAGAGQLVLAGAPLGNPADASPRLRAELAAADVVAAEDTRRLARLVRDLDVRPGGRVGAYFEANEVARTPELMVALLAGDRVLLITDGGMPSVIS